MITALAFVPKGAAKYQPERDEPTAEELEQLKADALNTGALDEDGMNEDDDDGDWATDSEDDEGSEDAAVARAREVAASMTEQSSSGAAATSTGHLEQALKKLDMDNYDAEEDNLISQMLSGNRIEYEGEDPYVTLPEAASDVEDDTIKPSDLLILAAKAEEDAATLEAWLFEEPGEDGEMNAYVHHDIMLPAFPLSVAWLNFDSRDPENPGNFVAVSTFEPEIEIWNLDVIDAMQPVSVLGGRMDSGMPQLPSKSAKKKKKKQGKDRVQFKEGSHTDSVLCLGWNSTFRNVLASGSADKTIKIWDLARGVCEHTLRVHTDKVQAMAWNPTEATVLLTGGFDQRACILDMRDPGTAVAAWKLSHDVECLAWNLHVPTQFVVSTEDGLVVCFDSRNGASAKPLYTLSAHDKPATSLCFNPLAPDMLVTASVDKTVKLWDVSDNAPKLVATEDLKVGSVFSVGFPSDMPHILAAGGSKGVVSVWDILYKADVKKRFGRHFRKAVS